MAAALIVSLQLVVAGAFLVAGAAKMSDLGHFRVALAGYGVLPSAAKVIAPVVPLLEIALGALMMPVNTRDLATIGLLGLLLLFTAASGVALARGRRGTPCACFGSSGHTLTSRIFVRNGAMAACLAIGLLPAASDLNVRASIVVCAVLIAVLAAFASAYAAVINQAGQEV